MADRSASPLIFKVICTSLGVEEGERERYLAAVAERGVAEKPYHVAKTITPTLENKHFLGPYALVLDKVDSDVSTRGAFAVVGPLNDRVAVPASGVYQLDLRAFVPAKLAWLVSTESAVFCQPKLFVIRHQRDSSGPQVIAFTEGSFVPASTHARVQEPPKTQHSVLHLSEAFAVEVGDQLQFLLSDVVDGLGDGGDAWVRSITAPAQLATGATHSLPTFQWVLTHEEKFSTEGVLAVISIKRV